MKNALSLCTAITGVLETAGFEDAHREAEELILSTLKLKRVELYRDNPCVSAEAAREIKNRLKKRLKRVPLQWILGCTDFYGLTILTPPGVFIPRPETELLVEHAIKLIKDNTLQAPCVADLCTGSGCIAIAISKNIPDARVFGTDISERAIRTARINADLNQTGNIRFLKGDLFEPLRGHVFDIIVSNPPYIKTSELTHLQPEIRIYEPEEALHAGEDGLLFFRRILTDAPGYLVSGGFLVFEIGINQLTPVLELARMNGFIPVDWIKDYTNVPRVLILRKANG